MRTFLTMIMTAFGFALYAGSPAQADWRTGTLGIPSSSPQYVSPVRKKARKRKASRKKYAKKSYAKKSSGKRKRKTARRASSGRALSGLASYYWQPQRVASGGWFNPNALTAAHKTLPFGTRVRVTNLRNGRSVIVRINDRGPYIRGRIIDLSRRAATVIAMRKAGVVPVRVKVL